MTIPAVLSGQQLSKRYGGIQALDQVDIDLYAGKVVALAGQNGAGKSTLVKIISGAVQPDSGVVFVDGVPLQLDSVTAAQRVGIRVVHQIPALAMDLSVLDNIFLGSEPGYPAPAWRRLARLDRKQMRRQAQPILETFAATSGFGSAAVGIAPHERRLVGIMKALANSAHVLIPRRANRCPAGRRAHLVVGFRPAFAARGIGDPVCIASSRGNRADCR